MNKIQYIDFVVEDLVFMTQLDDYYDSSYEYEIKYHVTKKNNNIMEFIDKSSPGLEGSLLVEQANAKLTFKCLQMGKRDFCVNLTDKMNKLLHSLALESGGDYISICDGVPTYVIEGEEHQAKTAVVLSTQSVPYSGGKGVSIELDEAHSLGMGFQIQKPINVFLQENPDLQASLQGLSFSDAMDKLAGELLKIRTKGDLTGDEFVDLYRQVGTIGITDKNLLQVYLLIKP